jgi:hypothetical protein
MEVIGQLHAPAALSPRKEPFVISSMEQGPSLEANSHSASEKLPQLLKKTRVHYRVDMSQQLVPILS